MDRKTFEEVVHKVPQLSADGLSDHRDPDYLNKRRLFLSEDAYFEQTLQALSFLSGIGKSERFSEWQRAHCTPKSLQDLLKWHTGHAISEGAIIAASLYLGFTMGVHEGSGVYFNFLAPQIESEMAQLRTLQQIKKVVGS